MSAPSLSPRSAPLNPETQSISRSLIGTLHLNSGTWISQCRIAHLHIHHHSPPSKSSPEPHPTGKARPPDSFTEFEAPKVKKAKTASPGLKTMSTKDPSFLETPDPTSSDSVSASSTPEANTLNACVGWFHTTTDRNTSSGVNILQGNIIRTQHINQSLTTHPLPDPTETPESTTTNLPGSRP